MHRRNQGARVTLARLFLGWATQRHATFRVRAFTVLISLVVGTLLAWARFVWLAKPAAVAKSNEKQIDPSEPDAILNAQKHEKALRVLADQYLDPQVAAQNTAVSFGVCKELGLIYLKQDNLNEADKLFTQLDNMKQLEAKCLLGRSAMRLSWLCETIRLNRTPCSKTFSTNASSRRIPNRAQKFPPLVQQLFQDPLMRYWLAQAIHYNQRGGVALKDMPQNLARFSDPSKPPKP